MSIANADDYTEERKSKNYERSEFRLFYNLLCNYIYWLQYPNAKAHNNRNGVVKWLQYSNAKLFCCNTRTRCCNTRTLSLQYPNAIKKKITKTYNINSGIKMTSSNEASGNKTSEYKALNKKES